MTPEQILADIRTDRVKKVIVDTDTFNEMDDQYAVAYAVASPKMDVLAINAAPFHNGRSTSKKHVSCQNGYRIGIFLLCREHPSTHRRIVHNIVMVQRRQMRQLDSDSRIIDGCRIGIVP